MTAASASLRFWVDMTLECVRRDHTPTLSAGDQRGPFRTARALGMALAALHDARALASGKTALLSIAATPNLVGSNPEVAGAAACAQTLRMRYPKQARFLDPAWDRWIILFEPGSGGSSSEQAGRAFGDAVHDFGVDDPIKAAPGAYSPSVPPIPYEHTAPPNEPMQSYAGGLWGCATPLLANRVTNFPPPPGRVSATVVNPTPHFALDFNKVATKGIEVITAGSRTLAEEIDGIFWGYDGPPELGTPPRLYMQVILTALDTIEARSPRKLNIDDELLVFAATGIALADAGIDAWHYKYAKTHMMWRPVVGIQRSTDANGAAIPGWIPLGRPDTNGMGLGLTPDFPAYPSGHATFGSAAFQLLRLFLVHKNISVFKPDGTDNFRFDFVSDEFNGRNIDPRTLHPREHMTIGYSSLWKAISDNSLSRVYLGVHWQFDGITKRNASDTDDEFGIPGSPSELGRTGGVWLGGQIANQIALKIGINAAIITASRM